MYDRTHMSSMDFVFTMPPFTVYDCEFCINTTAYSEWNKNNNTQRGRRPWMDGFVLRRICNHMCRLVIIAIILQNMNTNAHTHTHTRRERDVYVVEIALHLQALAPFVSFSVLLVHKRFVSMYSIVYFSDLCLAALTWLPSVSLWPNHLHMNVYEIASLSLLLAAFLSLSLWLQFDAVDQFLGPLFHVLFSLLTDQVGICVLGNGQSLKIPILSWLPLFSLSNIHFLELIILQCK